MSDLAQQTGDARGTQMLSFPYLRTMLKASAWVAVAVGAAGALVTRDTRFVACFAAAATIDLGTFWVIVSGAERTDGEEPVADAGRLPALIGGRIGLKAVLLLAALWLFGTPGLIGATLGVLVVDTTFLVVGPIVAARRTFSIEPRSRSNGGRGE